MEEYGGHECEFVESVPDRYKCTVCTRVLKDPQLTVCCGQHYCGTCMQQWFEKQQKKSCPHCRTEGVKFQHVENKGLRSEINELKVLCSNKAHGCNWMGKLGELKDHLKSSGDNGCDHGEIDCPNSCGAKVIRSNLASHIITACSHRQDKCQYCGKQDTLTAINEHKSDCPKFPLACLNNCDSLPMHREQMPEHLKTCPKRKEACPFKEDGCTVQLKPGELGMHIKTSTMQHMQMLANTNKEMRGKVEKTENQLKRMREEQAKEKESVKKLKQSLIFELRGLDCSAHDGMKHSAYEAIETILDDENDILTKPEPTVFRMLNFSKLAQSSTIWYSGPFKIQHYKLCLAIQPRGLGAGLNSHASVSLILLEVGTAATDEERPTFESLLSTIHVLAPLIKLGNGKYHRVYLSGICGSNLDLSPLKEGEEKRILGTREEWMEHEAVAKCLWNDSFIVKIDRAEDETSLQAALLRRLASDNGPGECRQS